MIVGSAQAGVSWLYQRVIHAGRHLPLRSLRGAHPDEGNLQEWLEGEVADTAIPSAPGPPGTVRGSGDAGRVAADALVRKDIRRLRARPEYIYQRTAPAAARLAPPPEVHRDHAQGGIPDGGIGGAATRTREQPDCR